MKKNFLVISLCVLVSFCALFIASCVKENLLSSSPLNSNAANSKAAAIAPAKDFNPGPDRVDDGGGDPCLSCLTTYPDSSNLPRSMVAFSESDVLVAAAPGPSICGAAPSFIKVWYTDEHALTLGVRRVIVKTSTGTSTTDYPITPTPAVPSVFYNPLMGSTILSGDQSGNDVAIDGGRPLWPALFITDLTVNGSLSRAGDWQNGGTGIPPTKIAGTWKAAVRTVDKTRIPYVITVTPDRDPSQKNNWNLGGGDAPPPGTHGEGFSAEVAWDVNSLNLIPGHTYRLQFMVHDGDQNKTGGDAGESCTVIVIPGA